MQLLIISEYPPNLAAPKLNKLPMLWLMLFTIDFSCMMSGLFNISKLYLLWNDFSKNGFVIPMNEYAATSELISN